MDAFTILAVVGVAVGLGMVIAFRWGHSVFVSNRAVEFDANEKSEPLSRQSLHWTIVHIRDDIPLIVIPLQLMCGLLAGILAALVLLLLR